MKKSETPRVRGRPRGFDRDRALAQAVRLFWERGYEGTAISELVKELRITPPALYTAFGSKEALFREALALYLHDGGSYFTEAIEDPDLSAREAVASILQQSARHFAGEGSGLSGCMLSTATLGCAPEHRAIADEVSATRRARRNLLADRLDRAVTDGELPVGTDSNALAAFYMAVLQGMAIQARDGAGTDSLLRMTVAAMNAWPTLERPIRADG
jgi:AcrR family transcriptional regulator